MVMECNYGGGLFLEFQPLTDCMLCEGVGDDQPYDHQLHVSALTAIFRLTDWQQTCKQLYFGMRLVYGGGVLGLDGGAQKI